MYDSTIVLLYILETSNLLYYTNFKLFFAHNCISTETSIVISKSFNRNAQSLISKQFFYIDSIEKMIIVCKLLIYNFWFTIIH